MNHKKLQIIAILIFLNLGAGISQAVPRYDTMSHGVSDLSKKSLNPKEHLLHDTITNADIVGRNSLTYLGGFMFAGAVKFVGDGQPLSHLVLDLTSQIGSGPGTELPTDLELRVAWGYSQTTLIADFFRNNIFSPTSVPPEISVSGSQLSGTTNKIGTVNGFPRWRVTADISAFYLQHGIQTVQSANHWIRIILLGTATNGSARIFTSGPQVGILPDIYGTGEVMIPGQPASQEPEPINYYYPGRSNYLTQIFTLPASALLLVQ